MGQKLEATRPSVGKRNLVRQKRLMTEGRCIELPIARGISQILEQHFAWQSANPLLLRI